MVKVLMMIKLFVVVTLAWIQVVVMMEFFFFFSWWAHGSIGEATWIHVIP
jgi:hypothetical protein